MKKFIIMLSLAILFISCSDPKRTTLFLTEQGYTDIKTTGFDFLAHGKDDWSTTGFTAIAPNGNKVKGAVSDINWKRFEESNE